MLYDLRDYRIPNKINLICCATGISYNLVFYGLRIIGAGDVKLLCATGAFVGKRIVAVIVNAFVIAALMGLFIVIYNMMVKGKRGNSIMHFSVPIVLGTAVEFTGLVYI